MFQHRQQRRRWAALVLLLWLFGVGAGVANACLAPNEAASSGHGFGLSAAESAHWRGVDDSGAAWPDGVAQAGHQDGHAGAHAGGQAQQGQAAKSNCQDFCEKASVSIAPLKSAIDDVQGHALSQVAIVVVRPVPAFAPVQRWVPRRDGVRAPPITIAFLRLVL